MDWEVRFFQMELLFTYDGVSIFDVDGKIAFCVEPGVRGASGIFTESALSTYIKGCESPEKDCVDFLLWVYQ